MKTRTRVGRGVARYLLVGALGAALAGCGGSSGDDDDPIDTGGDSSGLGDIDGDLDGDGIPNSQDEDYFGDIDGDGVPNAEDEDFDGSDIDGDGIANLDDPDVDGDGLANEDDTDFVEGDGDGDGFTDVSASAPCGGAGGTDPDSSTATWDDNCGVSRFGQFRNSLYTAGIQRVVYCAGFGDAADVDAFTDGDGGPATFGAVEAFQEANELTADGIVGPSTWGALQDELVIVTSAPLTGDGPFFDGYGVSGGRCADDVLFYQEIEQATSPTEAPTGLGWTLAGEDDRNQRVEFSIAPAGGRF